MAQREIKIPMTKIPNVKIKFSRHAKRRMQLYDISENDIYRALEEGARGITPDGKTYFIDDRQKKFKYPLKVVAIQQGDLLLIITAYPLKKGRK